MAFLLAFLDQIKKTDDPEAARRERLLAQAFQNDLNTAALMLDPLPVRRPVQNEDMQRMLSNLR